MSPNNSNNIILLGRDRASSLDLTRTRLPSPLFLNQEENIVIWLHSYRFVISATPYRLLYSSAKGFLLDSPFRPWRLSPPIRLLGRSLLQIRIQTLTLILTLAVVSRRRTKRTNSNPSSHSLQCLRTSPTPSPLLFRSRTRITRCRSLHPLNPRRPAHLQPSSTSPSTKTTAVSLPAPTTASGSTTAIHFARYSAEISSAGEGSESSRCFSDATYSPSLAAGPTRSTRSTK